MQRKPDWIKSEFDPESVRVTESLLRDMGLNTVCNEAACPNMGECFRKHTATFMILGVNCTRRCRFCNVTKASPSPVDISEPERVAEGAVRLGLRHAVITSVTRDDLPDGGADQFARVTNAIRNADSNIIIELLVPDFAGNLEAADIVLNSKPHIFGHNLETVPRLYETVRPGADYERSLRLLKYAADTGMITKTGIMLGLGETRGEVLELIRRAADAGCRVMTIGQYLRPSGEHLPVSEYVHPDVFAELGEEAKRVGIEYAYSAPMVRSSYNAQDAYNNLKLAQGIG